MVFKDKFDMYLSKFENYIEKYLDELKKDQVDEKLFDSIKYSLTSKGINLFTFFISFIRVSSDKIEEDSILYLLKYGNSFWNLLGDLKNKINKNKNNQINK